MRLAKYRSSRRLLGIEPPPRPRLLIKTFAAADNRHRASHGEAGQFSPREIVARVNVIMRRAAAVATPAREEAPLSHGALTLRPMQHVAEFGGRPLDLTAIEFAILKAFLVRGNIVFSRDQIMTAAYGANINVSDRTIDSHVRNIRAKLAQVGCDSVIETVHAVGFRLGRGTAGS